MSRSCQFLLLLPHKYQVTLSLASCWTPIIYDIYMSTTICLGTLTLFHYVSESIDSDALTGQLTPFHSDSHLSPTHAKVESTIIKVWIWLVLEQMLNLVRVAWIKHEHCLGSQSHYPIIFRACDDTDPSSSQPQLVYQPLGVPSLHYGPL